MVLPCNYGLEPGEVPPDNPTCVTNKTEQIEFLNPLNFIMYYNNEKFSSQNFKEKTIEKESFYANIQIDTSVPNFYEGNLRRDKVEDESSLLKVWYGTTEYDYL